METSCSAEKTLFIHSQLLESYVSLREQLCASEEEQHPDLSSSIAPLAQSLDAKCALRGGRGRGRGERKGTSGFEWGGRGSPWRQMSCERGGVR